MPTICTVSGDPILSGDAVCLAGFDPIAFPLRPVLVAKATAETLTVARSILGIAETVGLAARDGEALEVFVGGEVAENRRNLDLDELEAPQRIQRLGLARAYLPGTITIDVGGASPTDIDASVASYETIRLVGDLSHDVEVFVPRHDGWSGRVLDRTRARNPEASTVTILADARGLRVATARGRTQRVYVEYDGAVFNVRAESPPT